MSVQYQRFLKVLEKWPIDKTKSGRDLGEQLRNQLKSLADSSKYSSTELNDIDQQIGSLERLANNLHGKEYKRLLNSTATGLTVEQCNQVLSSEFLQYLNK